MPAPKKAKATLKTKTSPLANRKRLLIILAAFAAVGVALLIRSFASTIVVSVNYVNSFNRKDPNLSFISKGGTPTTVVSEPDGKKTVEYLQTGQDGLAYGFKLMPGFYQACINAKPTTSGAKAEVRSVLIGSTTAEPITVTTQEDGGKTRALNSFKETCVNVISRGQDQSLSAMFIPLAGTWRLSGLTVKTLDQETQTIDLNSAFTSKDPRFDFSGVSTFYDSKRGKNVLKVEQYGRVVFTVNGLQRPLVNAQFTAKAGAADSLLTVGVMRNQKGGEAQIPVSQPTGTSTYNVLTTSSYNIMGVFPGATDVSGVTSSNPLKVFLGSDKGVVYLDQFYFYNADYSSN